MNRVREKNKKNVTAYELIASEQIREIRTFSWQFYLLISNIVVSYQLSQCKNKACIVDEEVRIECGSVCKQGVSKNYDRHER